MQDMNAAILAAGKEHQAGNLDVAEAMYDSLLTQMGQPPDINLLYFYGTLLVQREKFGLGISMLLMANSLYDQHPGVLCNLGLAFKYIGRQDKALEFYEKAYSIEQSVEVLCGLSGYYVNQDESKLCEKYARQALAKSDHPSAHTHLGMALLEQGRFEEAWPHYEHRWQSADRIKWIRGYTSPEWKGERVKKLVIHGEQGLGDEILFLSLFHRAKELAEEIVIECAVPLTGIVSKAFNCRCYGTEAELKASESPENAHIAMGSLPMILGLPSGAPFMPRPNIVATGRPIIGLAWRGGTIRTNKDFRTIQASQFKPIIDSVAADFISIQYGGDYVDEEAEGLAIKTGPRDLDSLHYRIGICDLVITVCQTAVHQAGAMGVPCWVLTPRKSAWRYCGKNMLPWYSSVELFKQRGNEHWEVVIHRIARRLRERYASKAA